MALVFVKLSVNGNGVPGVFGWFWVYWMVISFLSVITFISRVFNIIRRPNLSYICIGLGCALTGIFELFIGIGDVHRDLIWLFLYLDTIALGLTMLSDTFIINLFAKRE